MTALQAGQPLEGTVYRVVRELGAGGMGVVYEVEHVRLKKRYVAKVMHEQVRGDSEAQKRMEREAQVLADINHPNIVQVHDVGNTPDGTSYFIMEKLEGMDLRSALKHGGVSRPRAIQITIDILDALDHVHQRGVVHRDIKPENVFLARQPTGTVTKVLDFGVVHIFDGDGRTSKDRITKTGGFVGTLYYAAPEQMKGDPASPPNDVYGTALLLFELVAGRGPFDDEPGVGLSRCFKPAPRLDAIVANAGAALADVVADALGIEPGPRPTAAAFAARLRSILASDPANARAAVGEVDDLLQNMALQSAHAPSVVPTAAPATPLMAGAPGHPSVAYGPTLAGASPLATAPTAFSHTTPPSHVTAQSNSFAPTLGDTSPGLYASVGSSSTTAPLAKQRSSFQLVSTVVAVIVLLGFAGGAGSWLLSRRTPKPNPAPAIVVASDPPPPATTVIPAPTPIVTAAASEPSAAPVASATASAAAKPAPAKPAAPAGHAKKDGYVDSL